MPLRERALQWLNGNPDDAVLKWLLGGLVAATLGVLALDYRQMYGAMPERGTPLPAMPGGDAVPPAEYLPPRRGSHPGGSPVRAPDPQLAGRMTFDLQADGRLIATGTIVPGTADSFAAEVGKRGGYVRTVVLHSPGGSVQDALKMGRLIRERGYHTAVESGRYCASSCPLVFAGGVERRAADRAAIGVHQVFAVTASGVGDAPGDHAQRISAECQRHLRDMGVDLEVWLRAMETPKEQLYYFSRNELTELRLATGPTPTASSR